MQNTSHYPSIPSLATGNQTFYEFPLYGQVRTYLRLEHLLKRLKQNASLANEVESELYFQSLFGLCGLLTQVHIRSILVKDLTKQREKFKSWQQNPDIDKSYLDSLCSKSYGLQQQLLQAPRLAQALRDDHFLLSFRQRFEVPAGICSFDSPQLHYWLSMPSTHLKAYTERWNNELAPIEEALGFWLEITRKSGVAQELIVKRGMHNQDAPDAHLVQIKLDTDHSVYPLVSNYKSRFSLRLVPFNEENTIADEIKVSLAAL